MTSYIGTDIVDISRVRQAIDRWGERFLGRVYTRDELDLYRHRLESLAANLAGKEAVMKVLGKGVKGISWRDIEILRAPGGRPLVNLYGRAKIEADALGIIDIDISLAHTGDIATATAIGTT